MTGAIKLLRLTSRYKTYYDDEECFKTELYRRYIVEERNKMLLSYEISGDQERGSPESRKEKMTREQSKNMEIGEEKWVRQEKMAMQEKFEPVRSRWEALKAEASAIFGNIWTFSMTDHKLIGSHYDQVVEYVFAKESVVTSLAETLGAFKKLHSIAYVEGSAEGVKRYESLFKKPYPFPERPSNEDIPTYKALSIGLDLLLRALQRAEIRPQSFALPSHSLGFDRFTTSVSPKILCDVFRDVHTLHLSQVSERYADSPYGPGVLHRGEPYHIKTPRDHEEVELTDENFPNLRDLKIDLRFHMAPADRKPVTSDDVVRLDRLTIRYNPLNAASALPLLRNAECLNHFGPYLKHLVLVNVFHGNWNQFFRRIANINLESLTIDIEKALYDAVRREIPGWTGLSCMRELFEGAAVTCTVQPAWAMTLVTRIWRDQEAAVDRLLEDSDQDGPYDWEERDDSGEEVGWDILSDESH